MCSVHSHCHFTKRKFCLAARALRVTGSGKQILLHRQKPGGDFLAGGGEGGRSVAGLEAEGQ